MARQMFLFFKAAPTAATASEAQIKAGNYRKAKRRFQGLLISVENPAGSVRSGVDRDGHKWRVTMRNAYGYLLGSLGVDGDHVDCYLGPESDAPTAYIVHQRKAGRWDEYDEDKVMLGFPSEAAAKAAYLRHYDDPRFLGPVTAMSMDEFKRKVLASRRHPRMLKAVPPGTHPEVKVRKDGVTQRYNIANDLPAPAPDPDLTALLKQYAGDAEVSPVELSEAVRQYRAVETRYRGTSGWLKAPNGQPTNLNERQWVLVRTPSFKRWFGDFDGLAQQEALDRFIDQAMVGPDPRGTLVLREVTPEETQEVLRQGGPDLHGMQHTLDALAIKHAVRQHGQSEESAKNPGHRPLTADDLKRIGAVLDGYDELTVQVRAANKTSIIYGRAFPDGKIEYVERVFETSAKHKPRLATKTAWVKAATGVESSLPRVSTPYRNTSLAFSSGRINPDTVSKMVDANGEPLVLYHGSDDAFSEFKWSDDIGFHFGSEQAARERLEQTGRAGGVIRPFFVSVRHPIRLRHDPGEWRLSDLVTALPKDVFADLEEAATEATEDYVEGADDMAQWLESHARLQEQLSVRLGIDGIEYGNAFEGRSSSYVAFRPTQVKSAAGNAGTFRPDLGHLNKALSTDPHPAYRDAIRKKLADLAVMQRQIAATDRKIHEAARDRLEVVQREIGEVSQKAYGDDNAGAKYRDLLTERARLHRLLS